MRAADVVCCMWVFMCFFGTDTCPHTASGEHDRGTPHSGDSSQPLKHIWDLLQITDFSCSPSPGVSLVFLFMGILSLPSDHHSVFKLASLQRTATLKDRKVDVSTDVDKVLCVVWVHLTGAFFLPCWSSQLRLPLQLHVSADYLPVFFCTGFLPVNRCLRCMSIW